MEVEEWEHFQNKERSYIQLEREKEVEEVKEVSGIGEKEGEQSYWSSIYYYS